MTRSFLIRYAAACMFAMIGCAAFRVALAIYLFDPIDVRPGLGMYEMTLLTAVCWGAAVTIAFGRKRNKCDAQ